MNLQGLFTPAPAAPAASAPPMTRCACTGRPFAEVAARMRREGWTAEEAERETTCGSLCTACVPDLRDYLRRPTGRSAR